MLEDIEPGVYLVEVMDEDGNISVIEVTITDEAIAAGQWKPGQGSVPGYAWPLAGLILLCLLLLLLWYNVKITLLMGENDKPVRTLRKLRRRRDEVIVAIETDKMQGSTHGVIILARAFSRRMRGNTLVVMVDDAEVLRTRVPEDQEGRFEVKIDSWIQ